MDLFADFASAGAESEVSPMSDGSVRMQVLGLVASMYAGAGLSDARRSERFAYPRLVYITPTAGDGQPSRVGTFVAAGRHISDTGLGFFHPDPIPFREVIVSLDSEGEDWRSFLMELRWCRFIRQGWYESGGRLLNTVPTPDFARDWPKQA